MYIKIGLWRAFPGRWPGGTPPAYKSIRKVASADHLLLIAGASGSARLRILHSRSMAREARCRTLVQGNGERIPRGLAPPRPTFVERLAQLRRNTSTKEGCINFAEPLFAKAAGALCSQEKLMCLRFAFDLGNCCLGTLLPWEKVLRRFLGSCLFVNAPGAFCTPEKSRGLFVGLALLLEALNQRDTVCVSRASAQQLAQLRQRTPMRAFLARFWRFRCWAK